MLVLEEIEKTGKMLKCFDLRLYKMKHRKDQIIRNCVDPNIGEYFSDSLKKLQIALN